MGLDDIRVKVDRAREHLGTLTADVDRFVSEKPYPLHVVTQYHGTARVRDVEWTRSPPLRWSAIVGDCIHNLRSALDHLVWELSGGSGNAPDGTEFPVFLDFPAYFQRDRRWQAARGSGLWKIRGIVADGAHAEFERLQPFKGPDPVRHPLWTIHELDRLDKHRSLNVLMGMAHDYFGLVRRNIGDDSELPPGWRRAFGTQSHLYRAQVGTGVKTQVKVRGDLAIYISLPPESVGSDDNLDVVLARLINFVETDVLSAFAPYL